MKPTAVIFSFVIGLLILQPGFGIFTTDPAIASCAKKETKKPGCVKSKCEKQAEEEEDEDCGMKRCNPLLGCSTGNFYLNYYTRISLDPLFYEKQQTHFFNDNRVLKQSSDCWHPPEVIS